MGALYLVGGGGGGIVVTTLGKSTANVCGAAPPLCTCCHDMYLIRAGTTFTFPFACYCGTYLFADASVPTIDLGVPNTEHGHCGKTMAILKHIALIASSIPDIRWVVVADDDTILR